MVLVPEGAAAARDPPTQWATSVQIWLNGEAITIENPDPKTTLLEWLREDRRLTGTHVGCWEGGCGICTVSLTRVPPGAAPGSPVETVPVNSCLRRLCMADGCSITTVEGVGTKANPHKIQTAIAEGNATQCGYCTPGWVMNMYSLLQKDPTPSAKTVEESFDGNLCRCTGYRPLLSAFGSFAAGGEKCGGHVSAKTPAGLLAYTPTPLHFTSKDGAVEYYKVLTLDQYTEAAALITKSGKKVKPLVANTAAGVVKYLQSQSILEDGTGYLDVSGIPDLHTITTSNTGLRVGAAVSIEKLVEALQANASVPQHGVVADHILRIASVQIRSVASWAGNLMLAREFPSFDSDMVIALGSANATFTIIAEDGSQKSGLKVTDLLATAGNILVCAVFVPSLLPTTLVRCFKTAMRHTFAHAIVNMGVCLTFKVGDPATIQTATVVIGGLCNQLLDATDVSVAVAGQQLSTATLVAAVTALKGQVAKVGPSSDPRWTGDYRLELATGFLYKTFLSARGAALPPQYASAVQDIITAASRPISSGSVDFAVDKDEAPVSSWQVKLDSMIQATGEAQYPSDIGVHRRALCAQIVFSTSANAKLVGLDPSAALKMEGVVDFIGADAIPGVNCVNPPFIAMFPDNAEEKLFFAVGDTVPCVGAMLGVVVATSWLGARRAAKQVAQSYTSAEPPVTSVADARRLGRSGAVPPKLPAIGKHGGGMRRGARYEFADGVAFEKPGRKLDAVTTSATASFVAHAQRHFYMETQATLATPVDGGAWEVIVSDSDCNTTQLCLSGILGVPAHKINVKCPRAGGSYGGKLTRQLLSAGPAVVAAHKLGCAVQIQNERSDDFQMVAGREQIVFDYTVTYEPTGRVQELDMELVMDPGFFYGDAVGDMSMGVGFSDNCYSYDKFTVKPTTALTNTPHTTAMRAPGCMQSILASEVIMEHVAKSVGKDLDEVHEMNFYQLADNPVTPFKDHIGQGGYNWTIPEVWSQLQASSDYTARKADVAAFNAANKWRKKGIALSPVKYVMFTSYYSSGALVCVYADGTVLVSTGGSELGQGLNTKVAMCAAYTLGVPLEKVTVGPRETSKIPNNTATGGSGTSESSSEATMLACQQIVARLKPYTDAGKSWDDAVAAAVADNVSLMASSWEHITDTVNTNHYATYGAAVSEVTVDVLTGEVLVDRVDILMDLGTQLDAAVDVGQVTGGFMIALGYLLNENVKFDGSGTNINAGTWEYKIPGAYDIPIVLNVSLLKDSPNPVGVLGSKGCAEPAMGTMPSVYLAIKNAIYAARSEVGTGDGWFLLNTPCSPDTIRAAIGDFDTREMIVP